MSLLYDIIHNGVSQLKPFHSDFTWLDAFTHFKKK